MSTVMEASPEAMPPPPAFPVNEADQRRNVLLFGAATALTLLGSPVLNVGRLHAPICRALGASDTVANLPGSAYLVMAASPLVIACLYPQVALLKRVLVIAYSLVAVSCGLVAASFLMPISNDLKIAGVVLQAIVTGGCLTTTTMFLFEMISRGAEPDKRSRALSLGYGVGPALGLCSALALQLWLNGNVFGLEIGKAGPPWNFALPFLVTVPVMGLAAWLSSRFVIAHPAEEPPRGPLLSSTFGQLGDFLRNRILFLTFLVGVISFWGVLIGGNMTLFTKESMGVEPQSMVGYQLAMRYGCKIVAGTLMGFVLARQGPRNTMLFTGMFAVAGIAWAIFARGYPYLIGFGLLGAGELFSVYHANYLLTASIPSQTRRNMGFASLTMLPAAPAPTLFGAISDHFGKAYTKTFGFQLSLAVALGFMVLTLVLTLLLPRDPKPVSSEETA
jgi:MFS family permease